MASASRASDREGCPHGVADPCDAVLLAAMAGRRVLAVIGEDGADADIVAGFVARQMKAAGALALMARAAPGMSLEDLLGQERGRPVDARELARDLEEAEAGLIAVADAGALDPPVLRALLRLVGTETGNGCFLQVLVAGDVALDIRLDEPDLAPLVRRFGMPRWYIPSGEPSAEPPAETERAIVPVALPPVPPLARGARRPPVWLPLAGLLLVFSVAAAAGALWMPGPTLPSPTLPTAPRPPQPLTPLAPPDSHPPDAPVPPAAEESAATDVKQAPPTRTAMHMPMPIPLVPPASEAGRLPPAPVPTVTRPHRPAAPVPTPARRGTAEVPKPEETACRSTGGPKARVGSVGDFLGSFVADVKGLGRCIGSLVEQKPASRNR